MTKIAGSGSISQKHGSEDRDPDPPKNVMVPEHWTLRFFPVEDNYNPILSFLSVSSARFACLVARSGRPE
jgi:hypothetical protein